MLQAEAHSQANGPYSSAAQLGMHRGHQSVLCAAQKHASRDVSNLLLGSGRPHGMQTFSNLRLC